jgi:hypothetical protein
MQEMILVQILPHSTLNLSPRKVCIHKATCLASRVCQHSYWPVFWRYMSVISIRTIIIFTLLRVSFQTSQMFGLHVMLGHPKIYIQSLIVSWIALRTDKNSGAQTPPDISDSLCQLSCNSIAPYVTSTESCIARRQIRTVALRHPQTFLSQLPCSSIAPYVTITASCILCRLGSTPRSGPISRLLP